VAEEIHNMRNSLPILLLLAILGCGPDTQPGTPFAKTGENQAERAEVAVPERVAPSLPEEIPDVKLPDAATVKRAMTAAQLKLGDPMTNSIGMILVPVPAGEFQMGSPDSDIGTISYQPRHLVKITEPFYLSVFEVTQQQYEKVMGVRPWQGEKFLKEGPDFPAVQVSWNDGTDFCRKLSEQEDMEYRLPTEAQWEYVCRAGATTVYSFGDDASELGQYAWHDENSWDIGQRYAHRVGQKLPNAWSLYDMHGNVAEWCADAPKNYRVLRGGSFLFGRFDCRSAHQERASPDFRNDFIGFRVLSTYKAEPAAVAKVPDAAAVKKRFTSSSRLASFDGRMGD
jgi:formylglycine-generating enzyme required for sulfatase activity